MSLSISAVSGYNTFYPIYNTNPVFPVDGADRVVRGAEKSYGTKNADSIDGTDGANPGKRVEKGECQTCKNRKYVDGSNEGDVSFKTPGHIAPESSGSVVMAHEQEHVSNAIAEGSKANKELVSVSVTLKTSVCPECGRVYVSGGTTHTTMRTTKEPTNPYAKLQRDMNRNLLAGMNFDQVA